MTSLRLTASWIVALLVAAALGAWFARPMERPLPAVPEAEAVVIGSSLMRFALPPSMPADAFPGLVGDVARIGYPQMRRGDVAAMVEIAVANGARHVLIEVNPLLFTFRGDLAGRNCSDIRCSLASSTAILRDNARHKLRAALGLSTRRAGYLAAANADPAAFEWEQRSSLSEDAYPLVFHEPDPEGRLRIAVAAGRSAGVDFALVLPPRSPAARQLLGDRQEAELLARARALANDLSAPLFAPQDGWNDSHFLDNAHMSRSGRAKFIADLQQWWRDRP